MKPSPFRLTAIFQPKSPAFPLRPADPTAVSKLVLSSEEPNSLHKALHSPDYQWTEHEVNAVLKSLWNHAPKALLFFHILSHHPSYNHHSSSFDHAISLQSRLRDFRATWNLLHKMRSLQLGPTRKTFSILCHRYASSGRPHSAAKLFSSMHEHGFLQDTYSCNTLLDVLCKTRKTELASTLFKSLSKNFKLDVVSYNIMANGYCLAKKVPRAVALLTKMVQNGISPNLGSYNIILNGYFRARQLDKAWKFFLEMKKRGCKPDVVTYTTLVHGLSYNGELKRAKKVFERMADEGVAPSVATYNAMIQSLWRRDCAESAVLLFDEMLEKGGSCSPNAMTWNLVIKGLCHEGKMGEAIEMMRRMKGENVGPNVQSYNVVIRNFCEMMEVERGLELLSEMEKEGCLPNGDTYNVLIHGMFWRKKPRDLVAAGRLMVEMIQRGFLPTNILFNRVLNGLLLTGNQPFAKQIIGVLSRSGRLPSSFKL